MNGNEPAQPGPTGQFPSGSLGPNDRGRLAVRLVKDPAHGRILMEFGTRLSWISMTIPEARVFIRALSGMADQMEAAAKERE